ncbi:hypothetical protein RIF29_38938 [Crotalaria pallida]|uniref:Uncharacterized protein n=1 Tax=Crotalaria pallida TaxID=3830 RepID=A0AAN9E5N6_CROPI
MTTLVVLLIMPNIARATGSKEDNVSTDYHDQVLFVAVRRCKQKSGSYNYVSATFKFLVQMEHGTWGATCNALMARLGARNITEGDALVMPKKMTND